ncbi:MAG: hypothetical protein ACRCXL_05355 [Dermatophilaceae bacterium]
MAVEVVARAVLWALVMGSVLSWPPRGGRVNVDSRPLGSGLGSGALALGRTRWRGRSPVGEAWVADFADVVSVGLRAGLDLGAAATAAARSPGVADHAPWLGPRLVEYLTAGRGVAQALDGVGSPSGADPLLRRDPSSTHPPGVGARHPQRPQRSPSSPADDLRGLAATWRLTEQVGASAAEVTAAAAAGVRARVAARQRASVVLAGPRTSMWLLTALPLSGPLVGSLLGFGPAELYGARPAQVAAGAGVVLTSAGWLWSSRLLARAARPSRTDGTR